MTTSTPRLRAQLITDAVIATYIHDISVRHRTRRQPKESQALRYLQAAGSRLTRRGASPSGDRPRVRLAAA